jgi:hypothetical protein
MINDRSPRDLALRALRDMTVIRSDFERGPYAQLWRDGFATRAAISGPDADRKRDYRLTIAGKVLAANLKPWDKTRG